MRLEDEYQQLNKKKGGQESFAQYQHADMLKVDRCSSLNIYQNRAMACVADELGRAPSSAVHESIALHKC
jgi:hypothetical protein